MQRLRRIGSSLVFGFALVGGVALSHSAEASKPVKTGHHSGNATSRVASTSSRASGMSSRVASSASPDASFTRHTHGGSKHAFGKGSKVRYASAGRSYGGGSLQCVPFARAASGIELKGNAANWWDAAAGVYDRGDAPEAGSVLNFRSNGRMRLGHVAVVTAIADARHIEIEHANWAGPGSNKSGVSHNIPVEDVSANNDWTAVRVGLGHTGEYGSTYPTYGFIYDRPDGGTRYAARRQSPTLAPQSVSYDEVAQAPVATRGSTARISGIFEEAPSHSVR